MEMKSFNIKTCHSAFNFSYSISNNDFDLFIFIFLRDFVKSRLISTTHWWVYVFIDEIKSSLKGVDTKTNSLSPLVTISKSFVRGFPMTSTLAFSISKSESVFDYKSEYLGYWLYEYKTINMNKKNIVSIWNLQDLRNFQRRNMPNARGVIQSWWNPQVNIRIHLTAHLPEMESADDEVINLMKYLMIIW